jgi:lipopolysaccharide export system protein LptA
MKPSRRIPPLALAALLAAPAAWLLAADAPPAPQPTVITSDDFESQSTANETTTVYTGHVVVTGTDLKLDCNRLLVISSRIGDPAATIGQQDKFKYLLATGQVRIVSAQREATCGRAEVLPLEDKVTLTENPIVTDHANGSVATGDKLILLKSVERVEGTNVRMVLPPIKDLGFHDQGKPPADAGGVPAAPAAQP